MAKDDYDVIAYKILVYYYGILKRAYVFQNEALNKLISKADIADEYFSDILRMMQGEGLITGAVFTRIWGNEYLLSNDTSEISITPAGISYLKGNSRMRQIGEKLKEIPGLVESLIRIVKP